MVHNSLSKDCKHYDPFDPHAGKEQIYIQLVLSLALGLSALLLFCYARPKWKSLYAARRYHSVYKYNLPELPDSLFGWIPVLHSVTEDQVLRAAGLDAYVVGLRYLIIGGFCVNFSSFFHFLRCL